MTAQPSPRLRAYVMAGIVGLAASLAVGDPAPALIGAIMLALGTVGLAGGRAPKVDMEVIHAPTSAVEGRPFDFMLRIGVSEPIGSAYVDLGLSDLRLIEVDGAMKLGDSAISLRTARGVAEVLVTVEPTAWGRSSIGPLVLHADSPLGMFELSVRDSSRHDLVTLPSESTLRQLLSPLDTNLHVGDLVSSRRGAGSEFADLRRFHEGDDPRELNWRVSSRFQTPWVNERHPERNGDVVILLDAQVQTGTEMQTLVDRSVRLAGSLLQGYTKRHHRLGLVTLDGLCRWVYPGMGALHRRRLLEQLMSVAPGEVIWEAAERAVVRAARRPSMVIALTPLLDPRMAGLVHSLRRSGVDVSVIALDLSPVLPAPVGQARLLGRRIWQMERDRLGDRLAGEGVPIVTWKMIDPPEVPLAVLERWRTSWRRLG